VFPIRLRPLRGGPEDIPAVAEHSRGVYRERAGPDVPAISPESMGCLWAYRFPGNVRELENEIERAVALAEPGRPIGLEHLSGRVREARRGAGRRGR
jgi:transcriptional regulator with PAS, ATPase and Fis domain